MAQRGRLRASDADRDQVADRLRNATAEGRLHAEELEQRLAVAFRARTYGELDGLVADLPGERSRRHSHGALRTWVAPALGLIAAAVVLMAVIVAVVIIVTGLLALWMVWAALAWWFFGRRRAVCAARRRRVARPYPVGVHAPGRR